MSLGHTHIYRSCAWPKKTPALWTGEPEFLLEKDQLVDPTIFMDQSATNTLAVNGRPRQADPS
jgi:hypothetical protein